VSYVKDVATRNARKPRTKAQPTGKGFGSRRSEAYTGSLENCPGILAVLDAVIAAGDGILLTLTTDGGALMIQLYDGKTKPRDWVHDQEELDAAIGLLAEMYLGPAEELAVNGM